MLETPKDLTKPCGKWIIDFEETDAGNSEEFLSAGRQRVVASGARIWVWMGKEKG
jgi:hypothetical protein